MKDNLKMIENFFYDYFQHYLFDEIDLNISKSDLSINSVSDLNAFVNAVEIRIFENSFAAIVAIPWLDEKIGIYTADIFSDEPWSSINLESETEIVEMDYD